MKVKEIVLREMDGSSKVTAINPDGSVEITNQTGIKTVLPKDQASSLAADPSNPNMLTLNAQKIAPTDANAQQQPDGPKVGQAVDIQATEDHGQVGSKEDKTDDLINDIMSPDIIHQRSNATDIEEAGGIIAQVNTKVNPPRVMDSTTGSMLSVTKSGEEITPELIARSSPDWQERSIQANGKTYQTLYSGTKGYKVGAKTYQEITGQSAPVRESEELTAVLRIAGLR